ncbi:MAG: ATP-binding protein [Methanomicrobiales archaeon]|nr:ATP-binding protein [Methanomicrobiales archaeon]
MTSPTEPDNAVLDMMEVLLTAEILNRYQHLDKNDLSPRLRGIAGVNGGTTALKRPVLISESLLKRERGGDEAVGRLKSNPFVKCEEFGGRLAITSLEPAARWFLKKGGEERIAANPALAYFFETNGMAEVSYAAVRERNPPYEDTKEYIEAKISHLLAENEEMRTARDLIIISAPEEIEQSLDLLVCTTEQEQILKKIGIALKKRDFLREKRIYEFGKLLFVGPPGTGKTSLALAMSRALHMPLLEVRLAMITSQYLGETSKNIDRIFDLAKRLAPCILFIDEFDFVAKSRITDDNAAMKRAVNMLLKNIDTTSFIKNGVLLIGATNHPWLLDEAAWRRFDEVVEFPLPDRNMRHQILEKITRTLDCRCDFEGLADRTEGFTGADLRIMIKESLISALMRGSEEIIPDDIEKGMDVVKNRDLIRRNQS